MGWWALEQSQGNAKLQKREMGSWSTRSSSGLLTGAYQSWTPTFPQRLETGALVLGVDWNKQEILLATLSFLRQVFLLGRKVVPGMLL